MKCVKHPRWLKRLPAGTHAFKLIAIHEASHKGAWIEVGDPSGHRQTTARIWIPNPFSGVHPITPR